MYIIYIYIYIFNPDAPKLGLPQNTLLHAPAACPEHWDQARSQENNLQCYVDSAIFVFFASATPTTVCCQGFDAI